MTAVTEISISIRTHCSHIDNDDDNDGSNDGSNDDDDGDDT
jgi:hypothetical protein